jgi:hypothetical protein
MSVAAWAVTVTVTYKPPAKTGVIYTVINYKRALGTTQNTSVSVVWGTFRKSATIPAPLGSCSQSAPSGFVLTLNHLKADQVLFTLTTDGSIVHTPLQGAAPGEAQHSCYKLVSW